MGFLGKMAKSTIGIGGADRVAKRLLDEIAARGAAGETDIWVEYTQDEIGLRASATTMAPMIRHQIEKAGHQVVEGEGASGYGNAVRFRVHPRP